MEAAASHAYGALVESDLLGMRGRFEGFAFEPGHAPLTTWQAPATALPAYLAAVFLAKALVGEGKGKGLRGLEGLVVAHNVALSLVSAALLLALAREVTLSLFSHGGLGRPGWFCGVEVSPGKFDLASGWLTAIYYVNYLLKYYEMGDTLLLAARGRPTPFLHVYHHAATLMLCWSQLVERSGVQWVPILMNLGVHTVMYLYYALATLGRRVWWKRHLTTLQILQFVVDMVACVAATWLKHRWDHGAADINCAGSVRAGFVGCGILGSYLVLFVKLYHDAYLSQGRKEKKA